MQHEQSRLRRTDIHSQLITYQNAYPNIATISNFDYAFRTGSPDKVSKLKAAFTYIANSSKYTILRYKLKAIFVKTNMKSTSRDVP